MACHPLYRLYHLGMSVHLLAAVTCVFAGLALLYITVNTNYLSFVMTEAQLNEFLGNTLSRHHPASMDTRAPTGSVLDITSDVVWKAALRMRMHRRPHEPVSKISESDLETFTVQLPRVLTGYNSPCWYDESKPNRSEDNFYTNKYGRHRHMSASLTQLRCFPSFFLLGFSKSGTTDLYKHMTRLDGVHASVVKEPHFWDRVRINLGRTPATRCNDTCRHASLADYIWLYDEAADRLEKETTPQGGATYRHGVIGDFTPSTVWDLREWQQIRGNEGLQEPRFISAHHIYGLRPQTKFIVIMRDPVERAYSHYRFFAGKSFTHKKPAFPAEDIKRRNITPEDFHNVATAAIEQLQACAKKTSWRACVYGVRYDYTMRAIFVSLYVIFLRDWMSVFSRDQFLFIKAEEYYEDRYPTMVETMAFLGLDTRVSVDTRLKLQSSRVSNDNGLQVADMLPATRTLLQDFYEPFNAKLSILLNDNRFLWK